MLDTDIDIRHRVCGRIWETSYQSAWCTWRTVLTYFLVCLQIESKPAGTRASYADSTRRTPRRRSDLGLMISRWTARMLMCRYTHTLTVPLHATLEPACTQRTVLDPFPRIAIKFLFARSFFCPTHPETFALTCSSLCWQYLQNQARSEHQTRCSAPLAIRKSDNEQKLFVAYSAPHLEVHVDNTATLTTWLYACSRAQQVTRTIGYAAAPPMEGRGTPGPNAKQTDELSK
jgi:hypothetical protein